MHRYIPIDYWVGNPTDMVSIRLTELYNQSKLFADRPLVYGLQAEAKHTYMPALMYVIMALMMALMVYIVIAYVIHKHGLALGKPMAEPMGKGLRDFLHVHYSYEGVARALRELFLEAKNKIRNRLCSRACTPREFAQIYKHEELFQRFASVYEDVVYGRKIVIGVSDVVQEMRRRLDEIK